MPANFFRSPWPLLILIVLVVLLFGANKLPGLARNMGQSMRIFKSEVSEMRKEGDDKNKSDEQAVAREYDPREETIKPREEASRVVEENPRVIDEEPYRRD